MLVYKVEHVLAKALAPYIKLYYVLTTCWSRAAFQTGMFQRR